MQLKAVHYKGISLAGAGPILGILVTGIGWFTNNVTATGQQVCVNGLPTAIVAGVAGLLTIGGVVGGILVLLKSPSTVPAVNIAAANESMKAGEVKP
jgi:hypothetical protein